jgi:subtilisin family serine protease
MERLRELSGGAVDFTGLERVDVQTAFALSRLATLPGFVGAIFPNVPPPARVRAVDAPAADPELAGRAWLRGIRAEAAWGLATGQGVVVADCDAGFYAAERDLAGNLLMDLRRDFGNPDEPLRVDDGGFTYHGTAVAAILAGVRDGQGTQGVAYDAKLVPLQNYNYDGRDTLDKEEATAMCVLHAITLPHVKVIVLENQTATGSSETFVGTREAVKLAIRAGIPVVSAAGNYSVELSAEAQEDTGSIIVGATDAQGDTAGFSNYGDRVNVAAYGEGVWTLFGPDGKMGDFGGTSGATPQVAGAVALMRQANPQLGPGELRDLLAATADRTLFNAQVGGLLQTDVAVRAAAGRAGSPDAQARAEAFRAQATRILQAP